jgi:hypothetical protein
MNTAKKVACDLVVLGSYTAVLLKLGKEVLDQVANGN